MLLKQTRRRGRIGLAAVLSAALVVAMPSLAAQLKPFDHASQDKSVAAFRHALITAVDARDFPALEKFLAPNIQLSFGGHAGIAAARKMFRDDPGLWAKLAHVLRRGGGFELERKTKRRIFVAPYTYFAKGPQGLDPFEFVILTGKHVAIRTEPSTSSAVLTRVSYDILPTVSGGISNRAWEHVKLPDGRSGYVTRQYVATVADHHAGFEKIGGQWKMIFFLAGD